MVLHRVLRPACAQKDTRALDASLPAWYSSVPNANSMPTLLFMHRRAARLACPIYQLLRGYLAWYLLGYVAPAVAQLLVRRHKGGLFLLCPGVLAYVGPKVVVPPLAALQRRFGHGFGRLTGVLVPLQHGHCIRPSRRPLRCIHRSIQAAIEFRPAISHFNPNYRLTQ